MIPFFFLSALIPASAVFPMPDLLDDLDVYLREEALFGTESGGNGGEERSKNRLIQWTEPGLRATKSLWRSIGVQGELSGRAFYDFTYYNNRERHQLQRAYLHTHRISFLYRVSPDLQDSTTGWSLALHGGRFHHRMTPGGLLYSGENTGGRFHWNYGFSSASWIKRARGDFFAIETGREIPLPGRTRADSSLAGGNVSLDFAGALSGLSVGYLSAAYDSRGRRALAHPGRNYLTGLDVSERLSEAYFDAIKTEFFPDRSALPDHRVQYHVLHIDGSLDPFVFQATFLHHFGRESIPDWNDRFSPVPSTTVQGSLAYMSLHTVFGTIRSSGTPGDSSAGGVRGDGARLEQPLLGWIYESPRIQDLELSLLWSTQEANSQDSIHKGYGSIRPEASVLGGISSIMVSGPPPAGISGPLGNHQGGQFLFEPFAEPKRAFESPDNRDLWPPDYQNGGIRAASVAYHYFFSHLSPSVRLTYGEGSGGSGLEGIFRLGWKKMVGDFQFDLFLSATGLQYRPDDWGRDPWTGLTSRGAIRYYSRYVFGLKAHY